MRGRIVIRNSSKKLKNIKNNVSVSTVAFLGLYKLQVKVPQTCSNEPSNRNRKKRYRYKLPLFTQNEDAVSNIVTSIMMLGIFLSILAMIFTVYIPIWAKTGEANHMENVESSFLDLKSTIDSQITDDEGIGSTRTTRIKLGAEGGAVLGIGRTTGSIDFKISGFNMEVFNSNDTMDTYGNSFGKIMFKSKNTYYADQYFTYENGAVIVEQETKAVMRSKPDFNIIYDELTNKTSVIVTQIQLSGQSDSADGTGHHTVDSTLVQSIGQSYKLVWTESKGFPYGQNITFNITTKFGSLWEDYLEAELKEFPDSVRVNQTDLTMNKYEDMYRIILKIDEVNELDCKKGIVEIRIN